jgi:hypothetical protein
MSKPEGVAINGGAGRPARNGRRTSRLLRLTAVFALTAPLWLAAGCRQGVGERCQVASDCDDGLFCVLPAGSTPQAGGTCEPPGGAASGDLGTDMTVTTPIGDMSSTPQID